MANFPVSLDSLTNPTSSSFQNSPSHSTQHINANDALEALEAKVGIDSSAVTTSHDYKLSRVLTGQKAVSSVKRTVTVASSAAPTPDADVTDIYTITALAENATIGSPTGTPTNGQTLIYRILDDGTARTLAWNAAYVAIGVTLPTTTVVSKYLYVGCMWNSTSSKWDVLAVNQQY